MQEGRGATPLPVHSPEFCPQPGQCNAHYARRGARVYTLADCKNCGGPRLERLMAYLRPLGRTVPVCRPCYDTRQPWGPALWLSRAARQAHGVPA